jgi:serine/threonine-protein kinase
VPKEPSREQSKRLTGNIFREIDPICDAFERQWQAGQRPDIRPLLGDLDPRLRAPLVRELILIDLEYRRFLGEELTTFDYLRYLPEDQKPILEAFRSFGLIESGQADGAIHDGRRESSASSTADRMQIERPSAVTVRFRVVEGPHIGREFTFQGHDNFIVGRASIAHFRLPKEDQYFSRVHFMVEVNPPNCRLLDMGSRNGTRVNGEKVGQYELKDGDQVRAGKTVIHVSIEGMTRDPDSAPATRAGTHTSPPNAATSIAPTKAWLGDSDTQTQIDPARRSPGAGSEDMSLPEIPGYRIVRVLGKGGMGIVYLANRHSDGMPVAIKMIQPTGDRSEMEVRRFLREASILQQLHHPRIVEFQHMGEVAEYLFFVMDFIPGCDAQQLVRRDGPLPVGSAVNLACQALEGLGYAHQHGVVHRDVKPSNLLVARQEEHPVCMLADFGLARVYQASRLSGLTLMGEIAGTIPFMPPEQITDFRGSGPGCDQYSLAATLFFLLTGHHIFDFSGIPCEKRMTKILFESPRRIEDYLPDVATELAVALHRALEKNPENRFSHVDTFREALEPFSI